MSDTIWWCEVLGRLELPLMCTGEIQLHRTCGLRPRPQRLVVEKQDGEWPEWIRTALIMYLYDDGGLRVDLEYVLDALLAAQGEAE